MRLIWSKKKHLPVLGIAEDHTYPIWRWRKARRLEKILDHYPGEYIRHMDYILDEHELWEENYLPDPAEVHHNDLILDVGAGEGETMAFYYLHGYHNFRLVEPSTKVRPQLNWNAKLFRRELGCNVEVCAEPFKPAHLDGVGFMKMDCEGCERELPHLDIPFVVEAHSIKIENKIFDEYKGRIRWARYWNEKATIFNISGK